MSRRTVVEEATTPRQHGGILVSDFDGTLTRRDFFRVVLECLAPPCAPGIWDDYRRGRITHFEALRAIYAAIRTDEATLLNLLPQMQLDPDLTEEVATLRAAGWEVVVASGGCDWYIRRLLAERGVTLEVHANPGRFEPGRGLLMQLPAASPYFSPTHGIDKAAVVRAAQRTVRRVAFAGDGNPDLEAAALVPPELRFARSDLARALTRDALPFQPFERWADVSRALLTS
jgi:2,3-diketo-5-methylthio-1-phosphopentane phosphatase